MDIKYIYTFCKGKYFIKIYEIILGAEKMDKNIKLLYCILASIILALLNNPVFYKAKFGLWLDKGYGSSIFGAITNYMTNILSYLGFLFIILFSILLLINNVKKLFKSES
jgi:hypothetical protein